MLYYPQLTSGAVTQLPIERRADTRTVSNLLLSGDSIRMSDPSGAMVRWKLQYSSLTDAEWSSLEQLFEAAEGQLSTFTFLDPVDNLLMWSEDWTKPVWTADPLIQISTGVADPLGGSNAVSITNTSQSTQRIIQNVAGPSWFQYCFSVYLRCDTPSTAQMLLSAAGQDAIIEIPVAISWSQVDHRDSLSLQVDGVDFGLQLSPGARIYAFGAQAEPQPAPGSYKRTTDRAGVYTHTRFESDSLTQTTSAPNQNSGTVNLVSSLV